MIVIQCRVTVDLKGNTNLTADKNVYLCRVGVRHYQEDLSVLDQLDCDRWRPSNDLAPTNEDMDLSHNGSNLPRLKKNMYQTL